jgi:hypothetical protein
MDQKHSRRSVLRPNEQNKIKIARTCSPGAIKNDAGNRRHESMKNVLKNVVRNGYECLKTAELRTKDRVPPF